MTYLFAQNVQLFGYGEQMKCHGSFISATSDVDGLCVKNVAMLI